MNYPEIASWLANYCAVIGLLFCLVAGAVHLFQFAVWARRKILQRRFAWANQTVLREGVRMWQAANPRGVEDLARLCDRVERSGAP